MTNRKRITQGMTIYVIDYVNVKNASKAYAMKGIVEEADEKKIEVRLENNVIRKYRKSAFGKLIFVDMMTALNVAEDLPKPGMVLYQTIGSRIKKKVVRCISGKYVRESFQLFLRFTSGEETPIDALNSSLFADKITARRFINVLR